MSRMDVGQEIYNAYGHRDAALCEKIVEGLRKLDVRTDAHEGLDLAESFNMKISARLGNARAVVALWTENSCNSEFVGKEATLARSKQKLVSVVFGPYDEDRLKRPDLPVAFCSMTHFDLSGWNGGIGEPCFGDLVCAILEVAIAEKNKSRSMDWARGLYLAAREKQVPLGGFRASLKKALEEESP